MIVSLIAAVAENGVIGADNDMPWRLGTDMRRFRSLTWGLPMVMGRRTFDSIGRALPGRHTIVMTHRRGWRAPGGVGVAHCLDEAFEQARIWASRPVNDAGHRRAAEICVVGGGVVYEEALPRADWLRLTHVDAAPQGDVRFPAFDPERWQAVSAVDVPAGPRDEFDTRYRTYRRR